MNNIDIARKYVIMHLKRFSIMHDMKNGTDTYNTAYIEHHADQIIFELIKETYIDKISTDPMSLYEASGKAGCEDEVKQNSRLLQDSIYYMDKLDEYHKNEFNYVSTLPKEANMSNLKDRRQGYSLTIYAKTNLEILKELKILKYVSTKRITSVKKIDNYKLRYEFEEYREYFRRIHKRITGNKTVSEEDIAEPNNTVRKIDENEEYILYSCILATLEMRYALETVNAFADKISEYNNCKSSSKLPNDCIEKARVFSDIFYYKVDSSYYMRENRLILMRLNLINSITPDNFYEVCEKYKSELEYAFLAKQSILFDEGIKEIIRNADIADKRHFIESRYNIWEILEKDLDWDNKIKKESNMRNIFKKWVCDVKPQRKK